MGIGRGMKPPVYHDHPEYSPAVQSGNVMLSDACAEV